MHYWQTLKRPLNRVESNNNQTFTTLIPNMRNFFTSLLLIVSFSSGAQLPDGTLAPDFTLTDYYGNTHHLYDYLNDGKTVFVEIFAAHCSSCWNYHETDILKDLYNSYGPAGSDEVMVLALEYDPYNDSTAFTGNHDPWVTQGNWLDGTPYPIFNVEGADRSVFTDYDVTYYPVIYKICPGDKLTEQVFTYETVSQLYQKVQNCPPLGVSERIDIGKVHLDALSNQLVIEKFEDVSTIRVFNVQGQAVQTIDNVNSSRITLQKLPQGIYLFEIQAREGVVVKKLYAR